MVVFIRASTPRGSITATVIDPPSPPHRTLTPTQTLNPKNPKFLGSLVPTRARTRVRNHMLTPPAILQASSNSVTATGTRGNGPGGLSTERASSGLGVRRRYRRARRAKATSVRCGGVATACVSMLRVLLLWPPVRHAQRGSAPVHFSSLQTCPAPLSHSFLPSAPPPKTALRLPDNPTPARSEGSAQCRRVCQRAARGHGKGEGVDGSRWESSIMASGSTGVVGSLLLACTECVLALSDGCLRA